MEHLQAFIYDCDRRTELAKRRLAETQEELSAEVAAKANKVHELAEQIGKKLAKAEHLGAEGNVEESLKAMEEVEEIRKKKLQAEQEYRNSMPASSYQQQKLRVCEVCSAYLGIHDNDRRLADHFGGKLHLGFIKIREKLEDLKVKKNLLMIVGKNKRLNAIENVAKEEMKEGLEEKEESDRMILKLGIVFVTVVRVVEVAVVVLDGVTEDRDLATAVEDPLLVLDARDPGLALHRNAATDRHEDLGLETGSEEMAVGKEDATGHVHLDRLKKNDELK
uniref:Uncharacterized protein n=1 Tax=Strigamia maritima TaxID=126957 RepID=T1JBL2_STRMM